jgi:hypothetical protein
MLGGVTADPTRCTLHNTSGSATANDDTKYEHVLANTTTTLCPSCSNEAQPSSHSLTSRACRFAQTYEERKGTDMRVVERA